MQTNSPALFTLLGNAIDALDARDVVMQLEQGSVIFLPQLAFTLLPEEQVLYTDQLLTGKSKNISYNGQTQKIHGVRNEIEISKAMMARYSLFAGQLIQRLFPSYQAAIQMARTSYRPAEVAGRVAASYRKDDTRLHVDAFPATPNQGNRLLRVFSNINPFDQPRVWHLGESFQTVLNRFAPTLKRPFALKKYFLKKFGVTKSLRSDYDALMLQLHDEMKRDVDYQKTVAYDRIAFPAGSSWIVFTDQVSHAALAGQFCLEQTFLLPPHAMQDIQASPLKVLEKYFGRQLV